MDGCYVPNQVMPPYVIFPTFLFNATGFLVRDDSRVCRIDLLYRDSVGVDSYHPIIAIRKD